MLIKTKTNPKYKELGDFMAKKIIFIHGRATKPLKSDLEKLWYDAVKMGLKRYQGEKGAKAVQAFDDMAKEFVYYGDISNEFLHRVKGETIPDDIESRREALLKFDKVNASDFSKSAYEGVSKNGYLMEALADTFSGALSFLRMGKSLVSAVAPDMAHYWDKDSYFGSEVRNTLTEVLKQSFDNDDEIMLVSHSLGTMISYDNLWKFSHYGEYRKNYGANKKVDLFVTMGSPLGDENVKRELKGRDKKGKLRYPHNINRWVNIAAEDDYISHDSKLQNDFEAMHELGLMDQPIKDIYPIYNLTVRNGKSNPHSSTGYLVHPEFTELLWHWMNS